MNTPEFSLVELPDRLHLLLGDRLLGVYHYRDDHKPHWHPLSTPAGHCLTLARPHDHLHHKGLMYALRTEKINFMEETLGADGAEIGRQVHRGFGTMVRSGTEVSFQQHLDWCGSSDGNPVFKEVRCQRIHLSPSGGLLLEWRTHLTATCPLKLVQSPWSRPNREGIRINYHGLILRLPREWCGTGNHGFAADGKTMSAAEAFGNRVHEATYYGAMDGQPCLTFASATLRQFQDHRLCLRDEPFAWMTMGPSNGGDLPLVAGQVLDERYEVELRDGRPF